MTRLLAGDVGGTKTLLRLFSVGEDPGEHLDRRYESAAHATFDEVLEDFLSGAQPVDAACLAIAGPIRGDSGRVTNLPWYLDARDLAGRFGIARVRLVNDFYGVAASLPLLGGNDLRTLNSGDPDPASPRAVLGAGTGLGEAIVIPDRDRWLVVPGEGGHSDFAPADELQDQLLRALRGRYGHVSWERVLSGQGIVEIHRFLHERKGGTARDDLDAAEIAQAARHGDPLASASMDLFVSIYGAEAGNLALKALARGGVYIAGGIAAKNIDRLTDGPFLESFVAKGRFEPVLRDIPVHVILNDRAGLLGASELARSLVAAQEPAP
jgi:glucokinase